MKTKKNHPTLDSVLEKVFSDGSDEEEIKSPYESEEEEEEQ